MHRGIRIVALVVLLCYSPANLEPGILYADIRRGRTA